MTLSVRYQPILHTLYYTLHTEHAYCLSYRFLNNVVITTVIEMVEMVEKLDRRLGKHSVERLRYVINNLLHLVIVKYGDISLVLCISTRLRLVTILSQLVKYLVILHADPCNKSCIYIFVYNFFCNLANYLLHCCSALLQNVVGNSGETQCLEEAEQQAEASVNVPIFLFKLLTQFPFVTFSLSLSAPFLNPLSSSSPPSLLSLLINSLSS